MKVCDYTCHAEPYEGGEILLVYSCACQDSYGVPIKLPEGQEVDRAWLQAQMRLNAFRAFSFWDSIVRAAQDEEKVALFLGEVGPSFLAGVREEFESNTAPVEEKLEAPLV